MDRAQGRTSSGWFRECWGCYNSADGKQWDAELETLGRIIVHRRPEPVALDCEKAIKNLRQSAAEMGMVVLPREPSEKMRKAGSQKRNTRYGTAAIYQAMIEAGEAEQ